MKIKNASARALAFCLCIGLLLPVCLSGCGTPDDDEDTTTPSTNDDFSGSLLPEAPNEEQKPPSDEGDASATYEIDSPADLLAMKRKGTYVLTADIDMMGHSWTPVGTYAAPFEGILDGGGFTIKNLNVSVKDPDAGECPSFSYVYAGLFGYIKDATVKNLVLENAKVSSQTNEAFYEIRLGAVAGSAENASFSHITVKTTTLEAQSTKFSVYSGGICGFAYKTSLSDCTVQAGISADSSHRSYTGGITAYVGDGSHITRCKAAGSVEATSSVGIAYAGGLTAYLVNSNITRCSATNNVSSTTRYRGAEGGAKGAAYAGGLVAYSGKTADCKPEDYNRIAISYATGSVSAISAPYSAYASGAVAYALYTAIRDCYSLSNVSASAEGVEGCVAGIVAIHATHNTYTGVFFAGALTLDVPDTSKAYHGDIIADDRGASDDSDTTAPVVFTKCAYQAGLTVLLNQTATPLKLVKGEDYAATDLRSENILTGSLGWNAEDWRFLIGEYPSIK